MAAKVVFVASCLLAAAQAGIIGSPLGLGLGGVALGSPLALSGGPSIVTSLGSPGKILTSAPLQLASPAVAVSSQSVTRTISPQLIAAPAIQTISLAPRAVLAAPAGITLAGPGVPGTKILGPDGGLIVSPGNPGGVVSTSLASPGLIAASPALVGTKIISGPVLGLNGINGLGINGLGINGLGINSLGINGLGIKGLGINGLGINGLGINGLGLNGLGGLQLANLRQW